MTAGCGYQVIFSDAGFRLNKGLRDDDQTVYRARGILGPVFACQGARRPKPMNIEKGGGCGGLKAPEHTVYVEFVI